MADATATRSDAESIHDAPSPHGGGWRSNRPLLLLLSVVVAVVGFGVGLVLSGRAERLIDDEVAIEAPTTTTTAAPTTTTTAAPTTTTTAAPTTTMTAAPTTTTTAAPTTTTTAAPTTTTTAAPTTTAVPPASVLTVPPPTAPPPVPTSVDASAPGTPALVSVAYAGQSSGVLRLPLGGQSTVVLSNVGGTSATWTAQASGYVSMGGGNRLTGTLGRGQSVGISVTAASAVPPGAGGAITISSGSGVVVVPIAVG